MMRKGRVRTMANLTSLDKRRIWVSALVALFIIGMAFFIYLLSPRSRDTKESIKVGFIMDGDESMPYTANFIRAMDGLERELKDRVEVEAKYNVPGDAVEEVVAEMAEKGMDLLFFNSYGYEEAAKKAAAAYPKVQICQATGDNANTSPILPNYHTFMGEIYQGRYVAGKVAGLKLKEMIDKGELKADEAYVGYVAAYPYAEVISGFTAFFLGVRSECPTALMKVRYAHSWGNYTKEREIADILIAEGCSIISQHSDTAGPAVACESYYGEKEVYHVGYNQDMMDLAPTSSLTGCRIDWSPYVMAAAEALLSGKKIEESVKGHIHGNDAGAGFLQGWVKMMELNLAIAPPGSEEAVNEAIEDFKKGKEQVFKGDYVGVDPADSGDICELKYGYQENANSSAPSFHYILKDVIVVEGETR